MKKIIISILALIMTVSMLTACSSDNDGSSEDMGDKIDSALDDASNAIDSNMDKAESKLQ